MKSFRWASIVTLSVALLTGGCSNNATQNKTSEEPVPKAPAATDADNTARNAYPNLPTAELQASNQSDTEITAAIRQAVIDDRSLSLNAHNVKIIAEDGVVTLRGPVKSPQERAAVEQKAKQAAGVKRVENLLEVERNP